MPLFAIAALSIREAASRRVAIVIAVATALAILVSTWAMAGLSNALQPREAVPGFDTGFTIFLAFGFSAGLGIAAAFVAAPAVASELEGGVALAILPRPISRAEYVLGKWLGLGALVAAYAFVAGGIELAAIAFSTGFTVPHPVLALAFLAAEAIVVMTLALCLGTRLPAIGAGILAVALFGIAWVDGFAISISEAVQNGAVLGVARAVAVVVPSDVLWRGAVFDLEPSALLAGGASGNPLLIAAPPSAWFLAWSALWFVAILALTIWAFRRRDI